MSLPISRAEKKLKPRNKANRVVQYHCLTPTTRVVIFSSLKKSSKDLEELSPTILNLPKRLLIWVEMSWSASSFSDSSSSMGSRTFWWRLNMFIGRYTRLRSPLHPLKTTLTWTWSPRSWWSGCWWRLLESYLSSLFFQSASSIKITSISQSPFQTKKGCVLWSYWKITFPVWKN